MNEATLNRLKAESMTVRQLQDELGRIRRAMTVAARPRELPRYRARLAVFLQVLSARDGGHACPQCQVNYVNTPDPRALCVPCVRHNEEARAAAGPQRAD